VLHGAGERGSRRDRRVGRRAGRLAPGRRAVHAAEHAPHTGRPDHEVAASDIARSLAHVDAPPTLPAVAAGSCAAGQAAPLWAPGGSPVRAQAVTSPSLPRSGLTRPARFAPPCAGGCSTARTTSSPTPCR